MTAIDLNSDFRRDGTRFRVFAQAPTLLSISSPETIWVSRPSGTVGPGPADSRMYVRDAVDKRVPYDGNRFGPPYAGPVYAPARPDRDGHFDHIEPGTRQFEAAHMYAVIRRVLDIWERYLGREIVWHFAAIHERLELIPLVVWDNAQSGFGFIESGYRDDGDGEPQLYCLNFDILAHEIGHSILFAEVGAPHEPGDQYLGFQESAADVMTLVATLHFDSVVDRLLSDTRGNLYTLNELNRFAEFSEVEQIRIASNDRRMSDFAEGWEKEHDLSAPLTGALFDVLLEIFHRELIARSLIDESLAADAYDSLLPQVDTHELQRRFDLAYRGRHEEFRRALLHARDRLGTLLAQVWTRLSPEELTYVDVGHALLDIDLETSHGAYRDVIFDCFRWREIGTVEPGPKFDAMPEDRARRVG